MELEEIARLLAAVGRADMALVAATRGEPLVELAEKWRADSKITGLGAETLEIYLLTIGQFSRAGLRTVADVTPLNVRAYMRARLAVGIDPETCNRNLAALTSFFGWLHAEGRVPLAQLLELRELYLPRPAPPPPEFMLVPRYGKLRRVADEIDPRFSLLVSFGVEAGLRYHEASQLWGEDFALAGVEWPWLRVSRTHDRENKRRRERTVPLTPEFARELLALDLPPGPIFPARERSGETLLSPYLNWGTFNGWRQDSLAETEHWTWHTLRHTFASWHVQDGRSIAKVAKWMGNSVEVCMRHYAGLVPGGDPEVVRRRKWFDANEAA